jgi:hypothetical protein
MDLLDPEIRGMSDSIGISDRNLRGGAQPMKRFLFRSVQYSAHKVIGAIAAPIAQFVPPSHAYAVVHRILMAMYPLFAIPYRRFCPPNRRRDWRSLILQRALSVMTRRRAGFDLKLRVIGGEDLDSVYRETGRVILCTAHFGLTLATPRVLADRGLPVALIADRAGGYDGWHWGLRERLQVLQEGPNVLLQARAALAKGIVVICYTDYIVAGKDSGERLMGISPNVFELAQRLRAALLFLGSRLEPDGTIDIEFFRPQNHRPESAEFVAACMDEFVAFVRLRTGWNCIIRRPVRRTARVIPV